MGTLLTERKQACMPVRVRDVNWIKLIILGGQLKVINGMKTTKQCRLSGNEVYHFTMVSSKTS